MPVLGLQDLKKQQQEAAKKTGYSIKLELDKQHTIFNMTRSHDLLKNYFYFLFIIIIILRNGHPGWSALA